MWKAATAGRDGEDASPLASSSVPARAGSRRRPHRSPPRSGRGSRACASRSSRRHQGTSCHGAGNWARTARYSGCSKKPWRGGFSRSRSGKPGTVASQPQWTPKVSRRWRAEVLAIDGAGGPPPQRPGDPQRLERQRLLEAFSQRGRRGRDDRPSNDRASRSSCWRAEAWVEDSYACRIACRTDGTSASGRCSSTLRIFVQLAAMDHPDRAEDAADRGPECFCCRR